MLLKDAIYFARSIKDSLLSEGYKDLVTSYNMITPNENLKNAYNTFSKNPNIKRIIKNELGTINGSIEKAIALKYIEPEDFIKAVEAASQENTKSLEKGQAKENMNKNITANENNGYWLIPCRSFSEVKRAAQMNKGDLPVYSFDVLRNKFGIEAPKPATHYKTDKSPAEMLEFMKTAPFFMSPSWCIAANKDYWDEYRLDPDKDKNPKCYVIISKQWPNVRFCIALSNVSGINIEESGFELFGKKDILELRDTWQCGGDDAVHTGMEMLKIAFPDADKIIQNISQAEAKIIGFAKFRYINTNEITDFDQLKDELKYACYDNAFQGNLEYAFDDQPYVYKFNIKSLPSLRIATYGLSDERIEEFTCDMPKLYDARFMFYYSTRLKKFSSNIESLINGDKMFYNCTSLKTFTNPMPKLKSGREMFYNCSKLETFTSPMPNLENGSDMFYNCTSLKTFSGDLSALVEGEDMFYGCKLDKKSVMNIVTGINIAPEGGLSPIAIGYAKGQLTVEEIAKLKRHMKNKNWDCVFLES